MAIALWVWLAYFRTAYATRIYSTSGTASAYRGQGIASAIIRQLLERVPGQHVGLQSEEAQAVYESLGFRAQPEFWSIVVGSWLDNDANR
jgi:GNAT superfamily N-acetyltransferase